MADPREDRHGPGEEACGQRSGDARQQPWPGAETQSVDRDAEPETPLADRAKPQGGVRSEDDDEMNSVVAPSDPTMVREDVLNTSTSSGLHPENEASGERLNEQHQRGAREISRMD